MRMYRLEAEVWEPLSSELLGEPHIIQHVLSACCVLRTQGAKPDGYLLTSGTSKKGTRDEPWDPLLLSHPLLPTQDLGSREAAQEILIIRKSARVLFMTSELFPFWQPMFWAGLTLILLRRRRWQWGDYRRPPPR